MFDTLTKWGKEAKDAYASFSWLEGGESAPDSHSETSTKETLSDASNLPYRAPAETNTGESVQKVGYSLNTPTALIAGGVGLLFLVVVLVLVLGRK